MLSVSPFWFPSAFCASLPHPPPSLFLCFSLSFILDYNHHLLQLAENAFLWQKEMEMEGLGVTAWGAGMGGRTVTQLDLNVKAGATATTDTHAGHFLPLVNRSLFIYLIKK